MAPEIRSSKITVPCPLFAADFDPRNNGYLVVGGGGGEGRSGVGNKIASLTLYPRADKSDSIETKEYALTEGHRFMTDTFKYLET